MARPKAKLSLVDRDKGYRRIVAELKKAHGDAYVKLGVMGSEAGEVHGDEGGHITTAQLAAVHEFGAPSVGIPERSFIRRTFDHKRTEWYSLMQALVGLIYAGKMTMGRALGLLGAKAAADIKNTITQGPEIPPPPKPATLKRKLELTRRLKEFAANQVVAKYDAREAARVRRRAGPITYEQHFASEQRKFAAAGKAAARVHRQRGSPRNLVDTGRLVNSITWQVVLGSTKEGQGG